MTEITKENVENISNKEGNIFSGILGGLIGGLIASIPWIITYVYLNIIWSLLAALIAMGFAFGYKKFNGPKNDMFPMLIAIGSIVIVLFVSIVVNPLLILAKEGFEASIANLKILYENMDMGAFYKELAFSIGFTILGISGVVKSEKK